MGGDGLRTGGTEKMAGVRRGLGDLREERRIRGFCAGDGIQEVLPCSQRLGCNFEDGIIIIEVIVAKFSGNCVRQRECFSDFVNGILLLSN